MTDVATPDDEIVSLVVTERLENGHTTANERLQNGRFAEMATHIESVSCRPDNVGDVVDGTDPRTVYRKSVPVVRRVASANHR